MSKIYSFHCLIKLSGVNKAKCDNPGGSVPSPFDSCNMCRCSESGEIGFCTEMGCPDRTSVSALRI